MVVHLAKARWCKIGPIGECSPELRVLCWEREREGEPWIEDLTNEMKAQKSIFCVCVSACRFKINNRAEREREREWTFATFCLVVWVN